MTNPPTDPKPFELNDGTKVTLIEYGYATLINNALRYHELFPSNYVAPPKTLKYRIRNKWSILKYRTGVKLLAMANKLGAYNESAW